MSGYIGTQPVPQATQTRDSFTCTAGQTSFATSGYTPNFLDVYLNGVKLTATDYTASNGSDVVLASGAATGDVLEVVAFTTFDVVTDTITAAGTALTLDRTGSDGTILDLKKDGSTVGSIGVDGDRLLLTNPVNGGSVVLAGDDTGGSETRLAMTNTTGSEAFRPFNSYSDAKFDLGSSSRRFKDLYLSGGVFLGGVGSSNKLSSYETGTWTPVLTNGGGDWTAASGSYTKVGNTVTIHFQFDGGDGDAGFYTGGNVTLTSASLPFTPNIDSYYAIPLYFAVGADATQKGTYGIFLRSSGDHPLRYFRDGSSPENISGDDLGSNAVIQSLLTYTTTA